jgi:D-beta-D-heptose 7-phosphate kinase/D-beta-D-heptose 1-phosphate adenosyltransferase
MQTLLPPVLPDFSQASILVIGDIMVDKYWFGDTLRISPEAPVPIVKIHDTNHRPGGAGNVALNIAALGATVTLIGITGNDEAAYLLKQQLTAANVNHDLCVLDAVSTIVKLRVISRHQQLIRLDFEEASLPNHQEILLERYQTHLSNVDLVILSDYQKGTLADPQHFIQLAKQQHVPVLVDPKGYDFHRYSYASILTPNFKEFETIVGLCNSEQDIAQKGRELLHQYHIETLLVTRGEEGMTLIQPTEVTHLPAYAREVFDVTGAGDTVIGVLGTAVALGVNLLTATALANLAASLVITKLGAASISSRELQVALTGKPNFVTGIVNEEQLLQAIRELQAQGKKIAFTNGCFDIIHAGHVTSLQMAKQLADYLIVAVNTDESVQQLKGQNRPINHLEHRMTVLAGLGAVDWVIPFSEDTPKRLLQLLRPNLLVKGGDYQLDEVVGADIVRAYGGEVCVMNHPITTSSTAIIHHMQERVSLNESN